MPLGEVPVPERPHIVDFADHALLYHLLGLLIERVAAVLRAHLQNLAGLLGGLHDLGALLDGVGDGLLHVDVFLRLDGRHRHGVVQVLRGHDENRVHGRILQDFPVVHVGLGSVAAHGLDPLHAALQVAAVGVADRRDLDQALGASVQPFHGVEAARAGPDEADVNLAVGALRGQGRRPGSYSDSGGTQNETSTRKVLGHDSSTPCF